MTKIYLALILTVACSFQAFSQSHLSFKVGFNSSHLNPDGGGGVGLSARVAYNLAFAYTYKARNAPFGFSVEPGYTLKGARVSVDTIDYKFDYLTLPFLLEFYPTRKLKISAGPEISYLAGARNVGAKKQVVDTVQVINITDNFDNRMELSGTVGISYQVDFFLDLGVRYNQAFTRVADLDPLINRRRLRNSYFQFVMLFRIAN